MLNNRNSNKQSKTSTESTSKKSETKKVPYENNGVKLCVTSYSERKKFVKECPPFQIVDGKMKQMRCLHKLVLPKEPKRKTGKVVKLTVSYVAKQAA